MKIFKDNINEIKKDIVKGTFEINGLHTSGKILNLYESMELLKDFSDVDIFYDKSILLKTSLGKKKKLQTKNFNNFKNYYFELYELFFGMKESLEKDILIDKSINDKDNIKLDNGIMFSLLREYYMTCRPHYLYSLFTGIDKSICISDKKNSNFSENISSGLLDNNYIFVDNRENVATMADVVLNLEQLLNKKDLELCGSKELYGYLYLDNFRYVKPLIERKKYLKWLIEKDSVYHSDIKDVFFEDYRCLLNNINMLSDIIKKDKYSIFEDKSIDTINYVYGQFLSDFYLYLNEEQQKEFLKFVRMRKNRLFKNDILYLLEELTGFSSYGLSKIVEEQYKKYTKKL